MDESEVVSAKSRQNHGERVRRAIEDRRSAVPDHYIVTFKKGTFPYETPKKGSRVPHFLDREGRTLPDRARREVAAIGGELTDVFPFGSGSFSAALTPDQAKRLFVSESIERIARMALS